MATSAFKSTTKRALTSSEASSSVSRSLRRSRSLSRFSPPIEHDSDDVVNATRGSTAEFPEISLDDLAFEFFSSSSRDEVEKKEREGRSITRRAEIGRWASDTASSSRRGRSASRTRGGVASSSSASRAKMVGLSDVRPRPRRSFSVARYQINDHQSEVGHSWKSSNRSNVKTPINGNGQMPLAPKSTASSNLRLRRTQSHKDLSMLHDGYSAEHHGEAAAHDGLYEVMRKELRYAVEEIRAELKQLEKSKEDLREKMFEERSSKVVEELPNLRASAVAEKPSRARKRSSDKHRMSKTLTEEAEKYFEGFITNVEDTDISSFDGERSDASSTLGGTWRPRDSTITITEAYKSPTESTPCPGETDGVILPWLHWETGQDDSLSSNTNTDTPLTPKARHWDPEKGKVSVHDPSNYSTSSCGSWRPSLFISTADKTEDRFQTRQLGNDCKSCYDLDEYVKLQNSEQLLFEMYREQSRINSGGLLLCSGVL